MTTDGGTTVTTTAADGTVVTLVLQCPPWCTRHAWRLEQDEGCLTVEEMATHYGEDSSAGGILSELRNPIDGRVERGGGGANWELMAFQSPLLDGTLPLGKGQSGPPLIQVTVHDGTDRVEIHVTSGEARSLAAQLVGIADLLDGVSR